MMEDLFIGMLLFIAVSVAILFLERYSERKKQNQYDERQLLMQKKAYTKAAWAAFCFNIVIWIEGDRLARYFSLSFVGLATFYLIVAVFASNSILSDAYFGKVKSRRFVLIYSLLLLMFAVTFVLQLQSGQLLLNGHLYLTGQNATPLLFLLSFGSVLLVTLYKIIKEKREDAE